MCIHACMHIRHITSTKNINRYRKGLTVFSAWACGFEWDTALSLLTAVCICVGGIAANRWGSHQFVPRPLHSFYQVSPVEKYIIKGLRRVSNCIININALLYKQALTFYCVDVKLSFLLFTDVHTFSHMRPGNAALSITFMYR